MEGAASKTAVSENILNVFRKLVLRYFIKKRGCPVMRMMRRKYAVSRMLTRFSQPTHVLTIAIILYLGFVLFPHKQQDPWEPSVLSSLLYVSTFAAHFGTQIWMTFISGIVLFLTLPRKIFGEVQQQLFPKYFFLNSILGFITFIIYVLHRPVKGSLSAQKVQMWVLAICFLSELVVRLYIVPDFLRVIQERAEIEAEAGVGMEIGRHDPGPLRKCSRYMKLHRTFRITHGACAVANIIALGCNTIHLYYLSVILCQRLSLNAG